jgi:hypothetical protein
MCSRQGGEQGVAEQIIDDAGATAGDRTISMVAY